MKKIFAIIVFVLFIVTPAYSYVNPYAFSAGYASGKILKKVIEMKSNNAKISGSDSSSIAMKRQRRIQKIAYKMLNSNKIPYRMTFLYSGSGEINASTSMNNRNIKIYRGMMDVIEYDDELAFVIGHEMAHAVDSHRGPVDGFFYRPMTKFVNRRIETRCDVRAVDYMVKAGYNPIAGIIIMNKFSDQPRFDWYRTHPSGAKRLAAIYFYISKNYPQYLKNNELIKNDIYQNFLITSQNEINDLENKYQNGLPEVFIKPQ